MLVVECNRSDEDILLQIYSSIVDGWVMLCGGFTKDSLTAVRVCHIILPTLVG